MLGSGFKALCSVSLRRCTFNPSPCLSIFFKGFATESYNEMLRDFVNKQELQPNLKSYVDAATRKEALRMSYLDLIRDKYVITGKDFPQKTKCPLCGVPHQYITYLNVPLLQQFMHETGVILSRHHTGTCKKHQRQLARCIKRARMAGLLPFMMTVKNIKLQESLKVAPDLEKLTGMEDNDLSDYLQERLDEVEKSEKEGTWDGKELMWDGSVKDHNAGDDLEIEAESPAEVAEESRAVEKAEKEDKGGDKEKAKEADEDVSSEDFVKLMNLLSTHEEKDKKDE